MVEAISRDPLLASYQEHGSLARFRGFLGIGSGEVQLDPAYELFQNLEERHLNTPLVAACTHIILERLKTPLPEGLEGHAFGQYLLTLTEQLTDYEEQLKGVFDSLQPVNYGSDDDPLYDIHYQSNQAKGLIAEAALWLAARHKNIPLSITTLQEDREGKDFFAVYRDGTSRYFDVTAAANKETLLSKIEKDGVTLLYMPIGGSPIIRGSEAEYVASALAVSMTWREDRVGVEDVLTGRVPTDFLHSEVLDRVLDSVVAASKSVYVYFEERSLISPQIREQAFAVLGALRRK